MFVIQALVQILENFVRYSETVLSFYLEDCNTAHSNVRSWMCPEFGLSLFCFPFNSTVCIRLTALRLLDVCDKRMPTVVKNSFRVKFEVAHSFCICPKWPSFMISFSISNQHLTQHDT